MTGAVIEHRCWNHAVREAVCRCPGCGRSFCRECVTEHEDRLMCASCLDGIARGTARHRSRWRPVLASAAVVGGLLLAWLTFYSAGRSVIEMNRRVGEQRWQGR